MQLSVGPYSYNRFDKFEESMSEGKDCECDDKDKKKKVKKGSVGYMGSEREEEEDGDVGGGEGGAMGEGFVPMNKAKMSRQADKAYAKEVVAAHHGKSKEANKQMQRRIAMNDPAGRKVQLMKKEEVESFFIEDEEGNIFEGKKDACYHKVKSRYDVWPSAYASGALVKCRKAGAKNWGNSAKKESFVDEFGNEYLLELNSNETKETVMENRMSSYARALGVMGAHYSGQPIEEKKADKDYDGDGKVESSKKEYFGSKDKAIKKAMKEGMMPPAEEEESEGGSKKEMIMKLLMKKIAEKKAKGMAECIDKEDVIEYLMVEGYASNEVSAEILHQHISDEFLAKIEEQMEGLL